MAVTVLCDRYPQEMGFADLARAMPGVSHKMLSVTLRALDRDGMVVRRVEPSAPPRVFYCPSELGRSLAAPLASLRAWAEQNMALVDANGAAWDQASAG